MIDEIRRQLAEYKTAVHRGNPTAQKYVRHVGALLTDHVLVRREDAVFYAEALNSVLLLDQRPSLALKILELRNVLVNSPPPAPSKAV